MAAEHKYVKLETRKDGVAMLWLDAAKGAVNTLSTKMGDELEPLLERIFSSPEIKAAVVISSKPDNFIVGADVSELDDVSDPLVAKRMMQRAQGIFNKIEACEKPFVAAIHGSCMGGGLELTLVCHYRIATDHPKTQLALPEVKLGIMPAAGGTQRLPKLIGLQAALDMMLTGKTVYAKKAKKLGLVDDVVVPFDLAEQAVTAALRLAESGVGRKPRKRSLAEQAMEDLSPARDMVFRKAFETVMKQSRGNYPAPMYILECVRTGLEEGMAAGLTREAELISQLITGEVSRQLMNLFFAMTAKKKHPKGKDAPKVNQVAVLGAGLMGAGIALVTATHTPTQILLKDISGDAVAAGQKYVFKDVNKRFEKKVYGRIERDRIMTRVTGVTDYDAFDRVNLVIEAVFEELSLKRKVLADVEAATSDDCVFASNTSALPIHEIAKGCKRPQNVIGMHYFSPVHKMPLLEIITTDQTSEYALKMAVGFGLAQGKTIIVVKDGPGFYTTRILAPLLNETALLLQDGATIEQIDQAMTRFGFPIGPVQLLDEIGIDVAAHVAQDLGAAFAQRGGKTSDLIPKIADAGYHGRKNKKGFYRYDPPAKKRLPIPDLFSKKKGKLPNEEIYDLVGAGHKTLDPEVIQHRNAFVFVNEAAYCLQEGVIESPEDGDLGAILGLGFPPFRGGPFRYVDTFGATELVEKMKNFADHYGRQFQPAQILEDYAKKGKTFYK